MINIKFRRVGERFTHFCIYIYISLRKWASLLIDFLLERYIFLIMPAKINPLSL